MQVRQCQGCDQEFATKDKRRRYCSVDCRVAHYYPGGKPKACPTCGAEFVGTGGQVYCCPEHRPPRANRPTHRAKKDISRVCECGERWAPAHEGVQTQKCPQCREADAMVHIYARHKDWRRAVFSRAKGLCADCGKAEQDTGGPHHAHHILPRSVGGQNTLVNGKLLCVLCHDKAHGGNALGGAVFGTNPSGDVLDRLADRLADRVADRVIDALRPYINL